MTAKNDTDGYRECKSSGKDLGGAFSVALSEQDAHSYSSADTENKARELYDSFYRERKAYCRHGVGTEQVADQYRIHDVTELERK